MQEHIEIFSLRGKEILPFAEDLFTLRIAIFKEFPYLWEGKIEEEKNSIYNKKFLESEDAVMVIAKDKRTKSIIGIASANSLKNEISDLQNILLQRGLNPAEFFYFRESMLLPEYRGLGIGKIFLQEREKIAKQHPQINHITFFCVERDHNDPRKPHDYRSPYLLWHKEGFKKRDDIHHTFEWKIVEEEKPIPNKIVFWIKNL